MLTNEQIKKLKKGDTITAELKFERVDIDKDIICSFPFAIKGGTSLGAQAFHPSCLSLPPAEPKYDPARLFKKGDIVKPCSVNGRWCTHTWEDRSGIHYEVAKDEDPLTAHLWLKDPDRPQPFLVHAAFFKLITPVEETEPYSIIVQPEGYRCARIMKGTKIHSSIPFDEEECVCRTLEEAKAAAEEERDRLNAEHGKEQV